MAEQKVFYKGFVCDVDLKINNGKISGSVIFPDRTAQLGVYSENFLEFLEAFHRTVDDYLNEKSKDITVSFPIRFENQLFNWEQWDQVADSVLYFYDCTLNRDFFPYYKKGEKFDGIELDMENSEIRFFHTPESAHANKPYRVFQLLLGLGEEIPQTT